MTGGSSAKTTTSIALAASAVVALCAIVVMVFVPHPSVDSVKRAQRKVKQDLLTSLASARTQAATVEAANSWHLWSGDSDQVTAALLSRLIHEVECRQVKLAGFRSQRSQVFGTIAELPYVVQVTGTCPSVRAMVASLDAPGTRIAVRTVQIAASDGATNAASATIGVSVFIRTPAAAVAAAGKEGLQHG